MIAALVLVCAVDAGWQHRGTKDGVELETRNINGADVETVRASAHSKVPVDVQADAIWGTAGKESVANKVVDVHEVIFDSPTKRIIYQTVAAPLVSVRDYTIQITRRKDGNVHEMLFQSIDDPKHPSTADKVRMTIKGQAVIEPDENGGSIITYQIYVDLAGSLPLFVVRSAQRDSAREWVQVMMARGEKALASKK
jgi:START domain